MALAIFFLILGMGVLGAAAYFLLKTKKEEPSGEYVWVGEGENPFK